MPMSSELRHSRPAVSAWRAVHRLLAAWPIVGLWIAVGALPVPTALAAADTESARRANEIEAYLPGHPKRALAEIATLLPRVDNNLADRRRLLALQGQALVASGQIAQAQAFADRIEDEAHASGEPLGLATALLIRSTIQGSIGDTGMANSLATQARAMLLGTDEPLLTHWALLQIGSTARARGRRDEAMGALHEALGRAELLDNAYRRSAVLYQLSILHLDLKQATRALEASLEAWKAAEAAGSAFAMVNAKMAESYACELLERPERELAAMEEALAIARKSQSKAAESRALTNLSDIMLRRHRYREALDLARRSLDLAEQLPEPTLIATSQGQYGVRAVRPFPRAGRQAAHRRGARGLRARQAPPPRSPGFWANMANTSRRPAITGPRSRSSTASASSTTRSRRPRTSESVLELQEKYESDKRQREIELLNRENDLQVGGAREPGAAERVWWLLARLRRVVPDRRRPLSEAPGDQPPAGARRTASSRSRAAAIR